MNDDSDSSPAGWKKVESVRGRPFRSSIPAPALDQLQAGTLAMDYRGVPFLKCPLDIALYLRLLSRQRPSTVIEIGTKNGGSALWFADMQSASGIPDARVISIDIAPSVSFSDSRIDFLRGDASDLSSVLTPEYLEGCRRPWLVVEDSSHLFRHTIAVLSFFHPLLRAGDYMVVEDGILSELSAPIYDRYEDGPNRAVAAFLEARGSSYEIDASLCDHFGYNATWNPNGWLRRM